jgi:hypothetical protein
MAKGIDLLQLLRGQFYIAKHSPSALHINVPYISKASFTVSSIELTHWPGGERRRLPFPLTSIFPFFCAPFRRLAVLFLVVAFKCKVIHGTSQYGNGSLI